MKKNAISTTIKETPITVRGLYKLENAIKADIDVFKNMSCVECATEWHNYYVSCHYNCLYDYDLDEDVFSYEDIKEELEDCRTAEYTLERYYGADDNMVVTLSLTLGYVGNDIVVKELTVGKVVYVGCSVFLVD